MLRSRCSPTWHLARRLSSVGSFERTVAALWTPERVRHLNGGRDDPLSPDKPGVAKLLRVIGLLGSDASLSADKHRKYRQLNAMLLAMEHSLAASLRERSDEPLRLVDLCSGASSHLALLLAFASRDRWDRPAEILAVDADPKRIRSAEQRAALLGFGHTVRFVTSRVASLDEWPRLHAAAFGRATAHEGGVIGPDGAPHGVFALHACDTATDEALEFALRSRARSVLVAPCCHAELAASWKQLAATTPSPFGLVHRQPNLRREVGAHITDALRMALLKAAGYVVSATEFVGAEHTPKNRLISATRQKSPRGGAAQGRVPPSAERARAAGLDEYFALKHATGGCGIALGALLGVDDEDDG